MEYLENVKDERRRLKVTANTYLRGKKEGILSPLTKVRSEFPQRWQGFRTDDVELCSARSPQPK